MATTVLTVGQTKGVHVLADVAVSHSPNTEQSVFFTIPDADYVSYNPDTELYTVFSKEGDTLALFPVVNTRALLARGAGSGSFSTTNIEREDDAYESVDGPPKMED